MLSFLGHRGPDEYGMRIYPNVHFDNAQEYGLAMETGFARPGGAVPR